MPCIGKKYMLIAVVRTPVCTNINAMLVLHTHAEKSACIPAACLYIQARLRILTYGATASRVFAGGTDEENWHGHCASCFHRSTGKKDSWSLRNFQSFGSIDFEKPTR